MATATKARAKARKTKINVEPTEVDEDLKQRIETLIEKTDESLKGDDISPEELKAFAEELLKEVGDLRDDNEKTTKKVEEAVNAVQDVVKEAKKGPKEDKDTKVRSEEWSRIVVEEEEPEKWFSSEDEDTSKLRNFGSKLKVKGKKAGAGVLNIARIPVPKTRKQVLVALSWFLIGRMV